ncbi:MAG: hypothetical protein IPP58_07450 [Holophagaceae bacterium]|uniref:Uncharacterized protein n=1 Tax=Candidatus Geothrix skivensis TaxID=2954439 RepID=A0A9D7SGZ8_9BACT|nr:hypothetical protein [Candidatus Geothrix skivensis]
MSPGDAITTTTRTRAGTTPAGGHPATAEQLRQARLEREAEAARQAWRARTLKVWFNGASLSWSVRVGHTLNTELTAQNGENRLEILEPDSVLRRVQLVGVHGADAPSGGFYPGQR